MQTDRIFVQFHGFIGIDQIIAIDVAIGDAVNRDGIVVLAEGNGRVAGQQRIAGIVNHAIDSDRARGDGAAGRGIAGSERPADFLVAVDIGPVGAVAADEGADVGATDGQGGDLAGVAIGQGDALDRTQLESDAAGQNDRVEQVQFEESLGA